MFVWISEENSTENWWTKLCTTAVDTNGHCNNDWVHFEIFLIYGLQIKPERSMSSSSHPNKIYVYVCYIYFVMFLGSLLSHLVFFATHLDKRHENFEARTESSGSKWWPEI